MSNLDVQIELPGSGTGRPKCGHSWPSNFSNEHSWLGSGSKALIGVQHPPESKTRARCEYYNRVLLKGRVQTTLINTWSTVGTSSPTQIK